MDVQPNSFAAQQQAEFSRLKCYTSEEDTAAWTKKIGHDVGMAPHILHRLAYSSDSDLRTAVGDHTNASVDVHLLLANDENPDVRFALAENHNVSRDILNMLTDDANPYVAHRAKRTLLRLSAEDSEHLCWRPDLRSA